MAETIKDPNIYYNEGSTAPKTGNIGKYNPPGGTDTTSTIFDPFSLFSSRGTDYITLPGGSKKSPGQLSLLDQLTSYYSQYAGGGTLPSYTGNQVAGLSGNEQRAGDIYKNLQPNDYTPLIQSILGLATGKPEYYEESYRKNVEDPTIDNWLTKLMPELKSQYAKKGLLYGSGREVAERESLEGLTGELTKGRVGLASNLEQMKTTAIPILASIMGLPLAEAERIATGLSTTGATERGVQQKGLDTQYANWLRQQPGTRPFETLLTQILGIDTTNPDETVVAPQRGRGPCIIVTICTSRDSEEVNIARDYRDKYLSIEQLRGYYIIAEKVVPYLKYNIIKKLVKKFLVDKLISHAKDKHNITTKLFLKLCEHFGQQQLSFVRSNGEIV